MMTLEDVQQAIAKLSPEDRRKLRLAEFEDGQAERREHETTASKLGRLAGRAVADFRNACSSHSATSCGRQSAPWTRPDAPVW
jgi:hypothetical protein